VIRLLVADDHAVLRAGMCRILGSETDLRIVAEAATAGDAIRLCQQETPDVAVLDYGLPDLDGAQATQRVLRACPRTRVLVVAVHANPEHATRALRAGAVGFVPKGSHVDELVVAVRKAAAGGMHVDPGLMEQILSHFGHHRADAPEAVLSDRELQVLTRLAEGWKTTEVATALGLSPSTVDSHRRRVLKKLGLRNAADLTRFAIRRGLIALD
jgi:two-component system, NarL family, invasion response regulator UvrY